MKNYVIKIETLSDTIFASAGGGAAVDSITTHYDNGIPYIPAKTIKGLLKESAVEIQEILGENWNPEDKDDPINILFGTEGDGKSGILSLMNGDLAKLEEYQNDIKEYAFLPEEVISYFTHIRHQTAMQNGVAKDGSLRTLRVLKPGLVFYVPVVLEGDNHIGLLSNACNNLRRVGANRNRGFGNIKCNLENGKDAAEVKKLEGNKFVMKLLTPALLPTSGADSNTVASEKIISGRKILGMLAGAYIKSNKIDNAHEDPTFKRLFLSGGVKFSDAYPTKDGTPCFPLGSHWVKDKENTEVVNDYSPEKASGNWKAIGGLVSSDAEKKATVATVLEFHNSRNKVKQSLKEDYHSRIKGSNQGDGIYYYENLQKDQQFVFKIEGSDEDLVHIRELLGNKELLKLGKSKSTALGHVSIQEYKGTLFKKAPEPDGDMILTFVSPVILRNDNGEFLPSLAGLSAALDKNLLIEPVNARLRTTKVQVYQGAIKMQFPEILAIAPGSSVKVTTDEYVQIKNKSIGEFTHEGFGKYIVESINDDTKSENLKKLIDKEKKSDKESGNKDNLRMDNATSELQKFIAEQLEITKAKSKATGQGMHKNTTMLMIAFMKDVQVLKSGGFEERINKIVEDYIDKNRFSNKIIDTLADKFNLGREDFVKLRKENSNDFKNKFGSALTNALCSSVNDFKCIDAKKAYWTTYFNNCKIKNRGNSEER